MFSLSDLSEFAPKLSPPNYYEVIHEETEF